MIIMSMVVFFLGSFFYGLTEYLYRGYTHWTMVITGGLVLLTFYFMTPVLLNMSVIRAATIGALIITAYEFIVGIIVNKIFDWNVWDYSHLNGNILGQICPRYTFYWFFLCLGFFAAVKFVLHYFW